MLTPQQTLLLFTDDVEFCELFTAVFSEAGFRVIPASALPQVKHILSRERLGVAVVDLMSHEQASGLTVLQAIKHTAGTGTPVVMLATHPDDPAIAQAKEFGANEVMVMPYMIETLVEAVARVTHNDFKWW
jgi:DNA-binding NtrC family response regulator